MGLCQVLVATLYGQKDMVKKVTEKIEGEREYLHKNQEDSSWNVWNL